jgi:hypothetical protein
MAAREAGLVGVQWQEARRRLPAAACAPVRLSVLGPGQVGGNRWCPSASQTDPHGAASGTYRGHRGGSWDSNAGSCRAAVRGYDGPDYPYYCIGFRMARSSVP